MTELQSRARDEIEKAFGEEICEHFHNLILRLSGDRFDLLNLSKYGDQFENGLIAIKAAREMADPHVVSSVEQLAELIDALQPNSPIFIQCAGAAQLAQLSVLNFVNALVTGVGAIAVLAPK